MYWVQCSLSSTGMYTPLYQVETSARQEGQRRWLVLQAACADSPSVSQQVVQVAWPQGLKMQIGRAHV